MATDGVASAVETDVLVVGAGPVGMTLALTLRKFGASVLIVDKEAETAATPRAAIVWPRTLEVLDLLSLSQGWQTGGIPLHNFSFTVDDHSAILALNGIDSPFPYPLGIGQDRTERLLDAALRESGADYRRGVEVADLEIGETVTATLRQGEQVLPVKATWVVGCEGSHSLVRQQAGIAFVGERNEGVQLVQGDVRVRGSLALEPNQVYLWSSAKAAMLLLPTHPDGHYRVLVTLPDDGVHGDPNLGTLQQLARRFLPDVVLSNPLWLNRYRVQHRIADTYRRERAFIVGDAAHVWVPIGGQGMNIGMQDAFNLGWKLAQVTQGLLPEAALDTYEAERRPISVQNIEDTQRIYGAILSPQSLSDRALRRLMPSLIGLAPVSHRIAERFSELDFHYAPNLLVCADRGGTGLRAGERAPDAWVARVKTGETVRLFDLYRTGRWQVFGWVLHPEDAAAVEASLSSLPASVDAYLVDATPQGVGDRTVLVLRDLLQRAVDAWDVSRSSVHVVRPDGVIAYRGEATKPVAEVMGSWFGVSGAGA